MCGVTSANYGVKVKNKIYANIRPYKQGRIPDQPCFSYEPIYYTTLVLHEFAHSFINDWVEKSCQNILVDIKKYKKILSGFAYGENIDVYISETIIRAIECLYVLNEFSDRYESYITEYENEGFILIRKVVEKIKSFNDLEKNNVKFSELIDDVCKLF